MQAILIWCNCRRVSGVMGLWLCDGGSYGSVPHEGTSVMGVSVCAEGHLVLWFSCRRVTGVMCTFRWLSEQKT